MFSPVRNKLQFESHTVCHLQNIFNMDKFNPLPDDKFIDSSKLKEFTDDNFISDENSRKLSKWVENTDGKRRNCSLRAISPFPAVFSKGLFPRGIKSCHCVGMG